MSESIESLKSSSSSSSPVHQSTGGSPRVTPNDPVFAAESRDAIELLTPKQRHAIELLAAGKKVAQVVAESGVSRKTLYRWRHEDATFIAELKQRRRELMHGAADRLASLLPRAVKVLAIQLRDPYDRMSFNAATAILRMANVRDLLVEKEEE
jgi:hypothetical protein